MPLPLIPIIAGIAALGTGAYGVKKGLDAMDDMEKAKRIGNEAQERHDAAVQALETSRQMTNTRMEELGQLKLRIITGPLKTWLEKLKTLRDPIRSGDSVKLEKMVADGLKLESGMTGSVVSGALAGLGAYGAAYAIAGAIGTASTGTAIGSLTGVAATNATLAWLGGGALTGGGLGVAGGTAVLGGIIAGPALAIAGLWLASEAEDAVKKAREYEEKVEQALETITSMENNLSALRQNVDVAEEFFTDWEHEFDTAHKEYEALQAEFSEQFEGDSGHMSQAELERIAKAGQELEQESQAPLRRMETAATKLEKALEIPIMNEDGSAVKNLRTKFAALS